jgi:hypothetical protein
MHVLTLISYPRGELLDEDILQRFGGRNEIELHAASDVSDPILGLHLKIHPTA